MPNEDPYSRLYWRLADEYPDVWDDDAAMATYARLLVSADGAWPAAAAVPVGVKSKAWALLTAGDSPLVIPEPHGKRYRIRGLDKHRQGRSDAARIAAGKRWRNADSNADSNAGAQQRAMHIPSRAEPSRDIPPTPAQRGTPRSNGTNPRSVLAREAKASGARARLREMAYQRGEISQAELDELRAADAAPATR